MSDLSSLEAGTRNSIATRGNEHHLDSTGHVFIKDTNEKGEFEKVKTNIVISIPRKLKKDIEFKNLNYFVYQNKETKYVLKNIFGCFKSGQLTAVMGPSGAGKSSLMNILAGYSTKHVTGDILVNGGLRDLRMFRKMSCYIMQDDQLPPHLSVEEVMMCSANLKLGESIPLMKKKVLVTNILESLGLQEARETRTVSLSGGQRKRLCIAQELVSNPPIMFFDEPTSGLDSSSGYQCISLLQKLARDGRTVVCSIHQPSAKLFSMFDRLYFIADGQCIYRGEVNQLVPYLGNHALVCPSYHNPVDFMMEVVCGEHGSHVQHLAKLIRTADLDRCSSQKSNKFSLADSTAAPSTVPQVVCFPGPVATDSPEPSVPSSSTTPPRTPTPTEATEQIEQDTHTFATSFLTQFRILFVRSFISALRDSTLMRLRLGSHLIVGFVIGLLYYKIGDDGTKAYYNAAFLFFCMLFVKFAALMPTLLTFPLEMSVFLREYLNYWYSLKAYYLAITLADLPFQICLPIVYGSIVYWMTGQPSDYFRFSMFLTICIQTALVGQSLGLVIGAATSLQVAIFLGPVTAIPVMLFSGFFVTLNAIPKYLQWLSYASYVRYSFEATLQTIYGFDRENLKCKSKAAVMCFSKPTQLLDVLGASNARLVVDVVVLGVFFVALRFLCYFILRWRIKCQN